jgi:hypothetical protein
VFPTLWKIQQRVLATFENNVYLSECCEYLLFCSGGNWNTLWSSYERVLDNKQICFPQGCPLTKQRGQTFDNMYLWLNYNLKWNIKKPLRVLITNRGSSHSYFFTHHGGGVPLGEHPYVLYSKVVSTCFISFHKYSSIIDTLKGPSHQIRFAWKWYDWIGLG